LVRVLGRADKERKIPPTLLIFSKTKMLHPVPFGTRTWQSFHAPIISIGSCLVRGGPKYSTGKNRR
jgi:hypothetical protein